MKLNFVAVTGKSEHLPVLQKQMEENFPKSESMPVKFMAKSKDIDLYAVFDRDLNNAFIGFEGRYVFGGGVYIFYLSVGKNFQGMGYGSRIINKIFELYPGKTVFLDLEQLDEKAENALQRQRRRRFYLRNGFYYTGMGLHYYGVDYELLSSSRQGETEKFKEIAEYLRPKGFKVTYSRLNY